jgi:hypothetical protein
MPFPHIDHCIICELTRPELGGKSTILGFYGIAPNVDIRLQDARLPITGLTFFFVAGAGEGTGSLTLEVNDWSGNPVISIPPHPIDLKQAERSNLVFGLAGLIKFPHVGKYLIRLLKDGDQIFRDSFKVSEGSPEEFAQFGAQVQPPK